MAWRNAEEGAGTPGTGAGAAAPPRPVPPAAPGGLRRQAPLTPLEIAVRYIAFAMIATVCNLAVQRLVLAALRQDEMVAFGWAPDLLKWLTDDVLGIEDRSPRALWLQWRGPIALMLAIAAGTLVGLVAKYLMDKRWIFFDPATGAKAHARRFALYSLFGLATTAIFWGSEALAWAVWETEFARETGAVLGLMVGYIAKYRFDRRFVFRSAGPTGTEMER